MTNAEKVQKAKLYFYGIKYNCMNSGCFNGFNLFIAIDESSLYYKTFDDLKEKTIEIGGFLQSVVSAKFQGLGIQEAIDYCYINKQLVEFKISELLKLADFFSNHPYKGITEKRKHGISSRKSIKFLRLIIQDIDSTINLFKNNEKTN